LQGGGSAAACVKKCARQGTAAAASPLSHGVLQCVQGMRVGGSGVRGAFHAAAVRGGSGAAADCRVPRRDDTRARRGRCNGARGREARGHTSSGGGGVGVRRAISRQRLGATRAAAVAGGALRAGPRPLGRKDPLEAAANCTAVACVDTALKRRWCCTTWVRGVAAAFSRLLTSTVRGLELELAGEPAAPCCTLACRLGVVCTPQSFSRWWRAVTRRPRGDERPRGAGTLAPVR